MNAIVKPQVFVSHISDEAPLADILKTHIANDFLGLIEVFVSSDLESIGAGENWLTSLDKALRRASILLVLCSHASVTRPWVNFEVGAAWIKDIPIVPVCHSGLEPVSLPIPFSVLQGIRAHDEHGLKRLYAQIAKKMGGRIPQNNLSPLVEEVKAFEKSYLPALLKVHSAEIDRQVAARRRVYEALTDRTHTWRTVARLAILGGISEDEVLEMLTKDSNVVFGKGKKSGGRIARLKHEEV